MRAFSLFSMYIHTCRDFTFACVVKYVCNHDKYVNPDTKEALFDNFSSTEHEDLRASYCDHPLFVVPPFV